VIMQYHINLLKAMFALVCVRVYLIVVSVLLRVQVSL